VVALRSLDHEGLCREPEWADALRAICDTELEAPAAPETRMDADHVRFYSVCVCPSVRLPASLPACLDL
jgi:hypothetical protein